MAAGPSDPGFIPPATDALADMDLFALHEKEVYKRIDVTGWFKPASCWLVLMCRLT